MKNTPEEFTIWLEFWLRAVNVNDKDRSLPAARVAEIEQMLSNTMDEQTPTFFSPAFYHYHPLANHSHPISC